MFKTLKKISKIIIVAVLTFSFSLFFNNININASTEDFYYISTSIGDSYDNVGVNYHCKYESSYVIYGTDQKLLNSEKVDSTSELWGTDQIGNDTNTGFDDRYVCTARLTGLTPNTKYYYQIVANDQKSSIYSFKTAPNNNSNKEIILLADSQSSSLSQFQRVDNVIKMLKKKATNASLAIIAGDVVDKGGYEAQWKNCFEGVTSYQNLTFATIPGNHEYYHTGTTYVDPSYYNQFFYNPQNGPVERLNSSYYFKYDNILFIMMDMIETNKYVEEHREWFKNVVENNPSQWIIVGTHAGLISGGNYAHDAKPMYNNFKDLFEYYQVDLAFSGHEHMYIRKENFYQGSTDETNGINYLVCPACGPKNYAYKEKESFNAPFDEIISQNQAYSGQVMRFNGDKLTIDYYFEDGTLATSFTINSKRKSEITPITNQEVEDSINFEYNASESRVYVSWSDNLYQNAKNVTITGGNVFSKDITSNYSNKHILKNIYPGSVYNFVCSITMNDDSVVKKEYTLDISWDKLSFNVEYDLNGGEWQSGFTPQTTFKNTDGISELPRPVYEGYAFKGWYDEAGNKIKTIPADSRKNFSLRAEWYNGSTTKKIKYDLAGGEFEGEVPTTYELFIGLDVLPTPTRKGYKFVGWQKKGEFVTSISDEETGNVTLTAVWEKTSGCKKSSAEIMIATLSALSLFTLVVRKKK